MVHNKKHRRRTFRLHARGVTFGRKRWHYVDIICWTYLANGIFYVVDNRNRLTYFHTTRETAKIISTALSARCQNMIP